MKRVARNLIADFLSRKMSRRMRPASRTAVLRREDFVTEGRQRGRRELSAERMTNREEEGGTEKVRRGCRRG